MVGTVISKNRRKCDVSVQKCADPDPHGHKFEDSEFKVVKKHGEAGKEQEKGSVQEGG